MSGHPSELWRHGVDGLWTGPNPPAGAVQLCTYAKLRGGGFGVRGWNLHDGQGVVAVAKSGKERLVHVRRVLWSDPDGRCLATVRELPSGRYYVNGAAPGQAPPVAQTVTGDPLLGARCGTCHHLDPAHPHGVNPSLGVCHDACECASCGALFWGL